MGGTDPRCRQDVVRRWRAPGREAARLLGCEPAAASGSRGTAGSSLVGFRVDAVEPPRLLVLTGRHRFSRYALAFRVETGTAAVRCRAASRACFPGWQGRLYRAAVIDRFVVRRMLGSIKQLANEDSAVSPGQA